MRDNRRRRRPALEQCEARSLLSTAFAGSTAPALVAGQANSEIVPLDGTFRGHYVSLDKIPDVGTTFTPTGSGHLEQLGRFGLQGRIQTIGFIQVGPVQGTLTLTSAQGTIKLQLVAETHEGGSAGVSGNFNYTVSDATGRYRGIQDSGTAALSTTPAKTAGMPFGVLRGRFTLVLTSVGA
jgi:hypothetical protein